MRRGTSSPPTISGSPASWLPRPWSRRSASSVSSTRKSTRRRSRSWRPPNGSCWPEECRTGRDAGHRRSGRKDDDMNTGLQDLLRYTHATAIVGDILRIRARDVGLGDMARVELPDGEQSLAQVIQLDGDEAS